MSKIKVGDRVGILRGHDDPVVGHKWAGRTGIVTDTVETEPFLMDGGYYVEVQIERVYKRESVDLPVVAFFVDEVYPHGR